MLFLYCMQLFVLLCLYCVCIVCSCLCCCLCVVFVLFVVICTVLVKFVVESCYANTTCRLLQIVYYDGQFDDARYNLAVAMTATLAGATVVNHAKVTRLLKNAEGRVVGAAVRDTLTGAQPCKAATPPLTMC